MDELKITWVLVEGWNDLFFIASTPVTFAQYDKFCEATGYGKPIAEFGRGKQPVVNVNVADALAFCQWLSKETGTTIRLPEENEWEYAALGGNKSMGYDNSGSNSVDDVAWYSDNSGGTAHEVAEKKPNELGIYDMTGNVWEWCGVDGTIRGASWNDVYDSCQVFLVDVCDPVTRYDDIGFRVMREQSVVPIKDGTSKSGSVAATI